MLILRNSLYLFFISLIIYSCKKVEVDDTQVPLVLTSAVINIANESAELGGNIQHDGGNKITDRGVCWSINSKPGLNDNKISDGSGTGKFTVKATGLSPNTKYFVRAFATYEQETVYGGELSFITLKENEVSDIDGNIYKTVEIGTQIWLAENLKTTTLNDGTAIENPLNSSDWNELKTPGYCWYKNDFETYGKVYGGLYNWYAVNSEKLCPEGWHVPTDEDWEILRSYLGGVGEAGSKMKEVGFGHWNNQNTDATNESGFTGLPGGSRSDSSFDPFNFIRSTGRFWSADENETYESYANNYYLSSSLGNLTKTFSKKNFGYSVRCIQD
jgi:uncharacterized protein (TIGR02145 family)